MSNSMERLIRQGIDDCLSGVEERASLESRVLERLHGQRRAPVKLSAAMAFALLLVLLAAAALAAGALSGWFRVEQKQVGTLRSCVSDGETLYLLTAEGLHSWQPGQDAPMGLVTAEELSALGLSPEGLLCLDGKELYLLHPHTRTLWQLRQQKPERLADFAGTVLAEGDLRITSAVLQEERMLIRAVPADGLESEAQIFCWHLPTGKMEHLPLEGVLEICAYENEKFLVLREDTAAPSEKRLQLLVLDEKGTLAEILSSGPVQSMEGLMVHPESGRIYAFVNGAPSLWMGKEWSPMQGYALPVYTDAYAIVGESFAAVNFNDLQVIPFGAENSLSTLRICGLMPLNNEDVTFQQENPGVAVQREKDPALNPEDVQRAIADGDTTDLFHVKLDGDLLTMFRDGTLTAISQSALLTEDTQAMLPVFRDGLTADGSVYAVPSRVFVTVWESDESIPSTFGGLVQTQAQSASPYIASGRAGGAWAKAHYADYLLTTYISSFGTGKVDFRTPAFSAALNALRRADFSEVQQADTSVIAADVMVNLSGEAPASLTEGGNRDYSLEGAKEEPSQPRWQLPSAAGEGMQPIAPAQLTVYVLNPNAANPEMALRYLESIIANRSPETEAMLKPLSTSPALHPGVEAQIQWVIQEQQAFETENNLVPDEEGLENRINAIKGAPDSWAVEETRLQTYREKIAPHISLQLHPFLTRQARANGGIYDRMMEVVLRCVNGESTPEECLLGLDALMEE